MNIKNFFSATAFLLFISICAQAQIEIVPLSQYSRGMDAGSIASARTASLATDPQDTVITLKLPYIEDFSGTMAPLDTITYVLFNAATSDSVYQLRHLKMHGLSDGDKINVFNVQGINSTIIKATLSGFKYIKVIDEYSFQLFKDPGLTTPNPKGNVLMIRCNWIRSGPYGYSTYPDTLGFWPNNGGAFINDNVALNPISVGTATFDGVNYKGIPYSTGTVTGYGDNLTSHRFNLSSYTKKDSIYMSFYWQYRSLSDAPLASEYFALEFNVKNKDTTQWVEVWRHYGDPNDNLDTFRVKMLPVFIVDSTFHKNFRYRFRSYGILSGMFNVWNLDYIFIDTGRVASNPHTKDVTIVSVDNTCLKNYTSIPYQHFKALSGSDRTAQVYDSSIISMRTLKVGDTDYPTCYLNTRDNLNNNIHLTNTAYPPPGDAGPIPLTFQLKLETTLEATKMTAPYVLKQEYTFDNYDRKRPYDMSFNNFKAVETFFYDYYSYDDGSAEFAVKSDESGMTFANKFTILQADTVTDIDICFARSSGPNLTGRNIYLQVWKVDPLELIGNQLIAIQYNGTNGFVRYPLSDAANLVTGGNKYALTPGDYYFAYKQNFNDILSVGYDRNTDHLDKIFLTHVGDAEWSAFSDRTSLTGSLMIRPVFSKNEILTAVKSPAENNSKHFEIYPNPATEELHFTGEPEYISIYDITGKLIYEKSIKETSSILLPESMVEGLYIAILSKDGITEAKRLIMQ